MTTEQKAKAYDDALKRARALNNGEDIDVEAGTTTCEYIFPELKEPKENNDEKIRKELIAHFRNTRCVTEEGAEKIAQWVAWLEKQSEQKPYGQRKECEDCQFNYVGECKGYCQMKRDEQKPADNVEPKFKIEKGKWYVCIRDLFNGYMDKAFRKGDMYISTQDGSLIPSNINVPCKIVCCPDTYFRDWAIADAKDGDVLANGSNIFIFHFINGTRLMGYCHVNIDDGKFYDDLGANECFCTIDAIVAPATKEQRDLLFEKMTQAGYEWDNEKKELKKIEPKTLDADKVIGWLRKYWPFNVTLLADDVIEKFKKDFGL